LLAAGDADSHEVVLEFGLDRARGLLEQLTVERYRIALDQWRTKTPDDVAAAWQEIWHTVAAPQLLRDLVESPPAQKILALLREHVPNHAVMQERRQALLDDLPALVTIADPAAYLERLRQNARVQGGGGKGAWPDEETYEEVKEALTAFRDAVDKTSGQW